MNGYVANEHKMCDYGRTVGYQGGGNVLFLKFIQYNYSTEEKSLFSIIMGQKKVRPDMLKDYVHQGTNLLVYVLEMKKE